MRKLLQSNSDKLRQKWKLSDVTVRSLSAKGILVVGISAALLVLMAMIAAAPASASPVVTYDTVSGHVYDQYGTPLAYADVTIYYGEDNSIGPIECGEDGSFAFTNVPRAVSFYIKAEWADYTGFYYDGFTDGDQLNKNVIIYTDEEPSISISGYVYDDNHNALAGATVYLDYEYMVDPHVETTTDSDGYFVFDGLPMEISYTLGASYNGYFTDDEGNISDYAYEQDAVDQELSIYIPPAIEPRTPWNLPNPDWYYNDTNPFPVISTVITPTPAPVVTPTPAPVVTVTPSPTPTPTPTPVPSSSENTSLLSNNLLWILLAVLVLAALGTWYVTRHK